MSGTPQNRDVNAAQRAVLALQLRASKLTYAEIAQQCGYGSVSACRKAVLRELDRVVVSNVEELRKEEAAMLDQLHQKCWERLESDNHEKAMLFAVDRLLMISEARRKLFGLDVTPDEAAANQPYVKKIILTHQTSVEVSE